MKFTFSVSPNLRQPQTTKQIMWELTLALLVVFGFSLVFYGMNYGANYVLQAILLLAISIITTLVVEGLFSYVVRGKEKFSLKYVLNYLSSSFGWVSAIILTLMCPISITPYALCIATIIMIVFAKLLFGGFGNNIFNPAAAGRAIIFATFMGAATDVVTSATPTGVIASNFNWLVTDSEMISEMMNEVGGLWTLFSGWYAGAIGETSTLIILICGIILAIRKVIDWRVPVVYLGGIFVSAMVVALMNGVGAYNGIPGFIWYPLLHLCVGGAAFGAVFMLTDPVTSPTSAQGRVIFALGAAFLTVLIRIKANLPEGCLYSILIMNMLTPMIENALSGKQLQLRKKAMLIALGVCIFGLGSVALAGHVIEPKVKEPEVVKEDVLLTTSEDGLLDLVKQVEVSTLDDGTNVYTLSVCGYAGFNEEGKNNVIEINVKDNIISAIQVLEAVDSTYIGDQIANESYLSQFVGLDLSQTYECDAISGATISSRSVMAAIAQVQNELGF